MLARQLLPARPLSLNNGMLVGLNRQNALTGLRIARPGLNVGLRFASKTSEPQQINVKQVGVMNDIYIPKSTNWRKPSFDLIKSLFSRTLVFALNTAQVVMYKFRSPYKKRLDFIYFGSQAAKKFVLINDCFASKNSRFIENETSLWVSRALIKRMKEVPKATKVKWQLKSFIKPPKVVSINNIVLSPDRPFETLQVVYKFRTSTETTYYNKITGVNKTKRSKNKTDYWVFLIDTAQNPPTMQLLGSVFETPPKYKLPAASDDPVKIMKTMEKKGDIFRDEKYEFDSSLGEYDLVESAKRDASTDKNEFMEYFEKEKERREKAIAEAKEKK